MDTSFISHFNFRQYLYHNYYDLEIATNSIEFEIHQQGHLDHQ